MPSNGRHGTRSTALCAALVAAALGLSACSGGDGDEQPTPTASASVTASPPPQPEGGEGQQDALPVLAEGWAGILADVQVDACPTKAGKVRAKGTVTNTADESRDIVITVSWNAPDTTDPTMRLVWTSTEVPAGATKKWSVSGDLPSDAGRCIIGARAGTITS